MDTNYRKFKQIKIHTNSHISGYIVYVFPDTAVQTCVKETVGFETFCKVFSIFCRINLDPAENDPLEVDQKVRKVGIAVPGGAPALHSRVWAGVEVRVE